MRHLLKPLGEERASKVMRLIDKEDREGLESYLSETRVDEELKDKIFTLLELKGDESVIDEAKEVIDYDFGHLERLSALLREVGVDFTLNLGIARGLDYYTGVVFECYAEGLGAQKQVCGGGSYELSSLFGGPVTPSTGFAIGFDRVCEVCNVETRKKDSIAVISFKGLENHAFRVARKLRERGFTAIVDVMERSLKKQMSFASEIGARYAVILGPDEVKSGRVAVKNLETQEQVVVAEEELFSVLQ